MGVDSRIKRQSATCMLVPLLISSVFPSDSGVAQDERQGVSWSYSGIPAHAHAVDVEAGTKLSLNLRNQSLSIGLNF